MLLRRLSKHYQDFVTCKERNLSAAEHMTQQQGAGPEQPRYNAAECPVCLEPYSDDQGGRHVARTLTGCGHTVCHSCVAGRNTHLSRHLVLKPSCLSRQARDKHRETSTKRRVFAGMLKKVRAVKTKKGMMKSCKCPVCHHSKLVCLFSHTTHYETDLCALPRLARTATDNHKKQRSVCHA